MLCILYHSSIHWYLHGAVFTYQVIYRTIYLGLNKIASTNLNRIYIDFKLISHQNHLVGNISFSDFLKVDVTFIIYRTCFWVGFYYKFNLKCITIK